MHGSPPNDFPRGELAEFFGLHAGLELGNIPESARPAAESRHDSLERKIAHWPRNDSNDPFSAATKRLALDLGRATGCEVVPGFNEFCVPLLDDALDEASAMGSGTVVVVTPMMTGGGEHSEHDIPEAIDRARARHPSVEFVYAWPFPSEKVAEFLAGQVRAFLQEEALPGKGRG
jgi:sirohydrochlorin cobaltochelatase